MKPRLKTPQFFTVQGKLVRLVDTPSGGTTVEVFNPKTGAFDPDLSYLTKIFIPSDLDVDHLEESEFNLRVEALRRHPGNKEQA